MLAELAAANAAFAIIKTTISNGRELASCGKALGTFISCKEDLMREGNKKRARGVGGNDLEEFMALEQIREKEKQLKELMILGGRASRKTTRPGLFVRIVVTSWPMRRGCSTAATRSRAESATFWCASSS